MKLLDLTISQGGLSHRGVRLSLLALLALGCSELQARRHARAGNAAYLDGDYSSAVREYEAAESSFPSLPVVALNKGIACRQLMVLGSPSAEQQRVADCALAAFRRMKELRPDDPRGEQLFVQTLFDAGRFDTLVSVYEAELRDDPKNLSALNGLVTAYLRAERWAEALRWTTKRADIEAEDAELQYLVGVTVFNRLREKGGSDKDTFDPRPDSHRAREQAAPMKTPPPFSVGDVTGTERVQLADLGLSYLQRALKLRPSYREAMIFMSLLYRQRAVGSFDRPSEWLESVEAAKMWHERASNIAPQQAPSPMYL